MQTIRAMRGGGALWGSNLGEFCHVLADVGQISPSLANTGPKFANLDKIQSDLARIGKIVGQVLSNLAIVWPALARFGQLFANMVEFGPNLGPRRTF